MMAAILCFAVMWLGRGLLAANAPLRSAGDLEAMEVSLPSLRLTVPAPQAASRVPLTVPRTTEQVQQAGGPSASELDGDFPLHDVAESCGADSFSKNLEEARRLVGGGIDVNRVDEVLCPVLPCMAPCTCPCRHASE